MATVPIRRWFRFSLRTLLIAVTLVGLFLGWLGVQWKWLAGRREARRWLGAAKESMVSPAMPGKFRVDAPWSLRLLGEDGIVGIGLDEVEFAGPVPYTPEELQHLFPEARIEPSRDGRFVSDRRQAVDEHQPEARARVLCSSSFRVGVFSAGSRLRATRRIVTRLRVRGRRALARASGSCRRQTAAAARPAPPSFALPGDELG